jgi:hypothetical protein
MHPHPDMLRAIADGHVKDMLERHDDERRAAQARVDAAERVPERVGPSYRLKDGSWLHLRHESS